VQFRTEINVPPAPVRLGLGSPGLLLGSCFADQVGQRMHAHRFPAAANPLGVLFNPLSLMELLGLALQQQPLPPEGYLQRGPLWLHYSLPGSLAATSRAELAAQAAQAFARVRTWAQAPAPEPRWLVLTWGTAWAYRRRDQGQWVANCHKMPGQWFDKQLLTPDQVMEAWAALYPHLPADVHIICTVSPVRHVKDTLPLNGASKAVLRYVCHQMAAQYPNVSYFPAFELLVDDLRDYRFYQPDMLHPTPQAVDYVFEKFIEAYLTPAARQFVVEWADIQAGLAHRPLQPDREAYREFLSQLLGRLANLTQVDTRPEVAEIERRLTNL
jgi:GSCFA family